MRKSAPWFLGIVALLVGAAVITGRDQGRSISNPGLTTRNGSSCFVPNLAKSGSPAPSYLLRQFGPQPLFPNSDVRVEGEGWPPNNIYLYTLPEVEEAPAYGHRPNLTDCLGSLATPVGVAYVQGGGFTWQGRMPARVGERPWLLAINSAGDYLMQPLTWYGAGRVVPPYLLTVSGDASRPEETPPTHTITLGQPFRLVGSGLQNGSIRVRFEDDTIGTAEVRDGNLSVSDLVIPVTLLASGSPVTTPGDYQMYLVTSSQPSEIRYQLSLHVLPTPVDQQRLAAIWRLPQVQPLSPLFPREGGTAFCTLETSLGPVKAACTARIRSPQPSDFAVGIGEAPTDWRVITLGIDWEDPRKAMDRLAQVRRFALILLVDKDVHVNRILRVGDPPPIDAWSKLEA